MTDDRQSTPPLVGTILEGAYRVVRLLGEGGMGAVYEAVQLRLDKRVAVKVMARDLAANPEALARFRREAEVTSRIGHPHIVQVFDFGATPTGEPFLAMEFLEGEDLEHRIRRVGRLSPSITLHIIKQVAAALAATHAKGIVHRDLKPANIYLLEAAGETDFVKVLDFGISKVRASTTRLTKAAMVMGTPNYMSPEQALGQVEEIDARTDQWALACIAWEAMSGEGPFVGESIPSLLFQVVHEAPRPLVAKVPGLPREVEAVLLRALSKNKDDRFPNVTDFSLALESAITGTSASYLTPAPRAHGAEAFLPTQVTPAAGLPAGTPYAQPPLPTTFTQNAGQVEEMLDLHRPGSGRIWAAVGGAAVLLSLGAFLLFRSGPAPRPLPPSPPPAVPVSPAPSAAPPAVPPEAVPAAPIPPVPPPSPAPSDTGAAASPRPASGKKEAKRRARGHNAGAPVASHPATAPAPIASPAPTQPPTPTVGPRGGSKW